MNCGQRTGVKPVCRHCRAVRVLAGRAHLWYKQTLCVSILDHTAAPRVALLKPTAVNAILADVRRVQATGASVVSLMRGEPDFRTPEHIADAVVAAVRAGRTGYPDNRGELRFREAVAAKLARDNGVAYDPAPRFWPPPAPRSAWPAR